MEELKKVYDNGFPVNWWKIEAYFGMKLRRIPAYLDVFSMECRRI